MTFCSPRQKGSVAQLDARGHGLFWEAVQERGSREPSVSFRMSSVVYYRGSRDRREPPDFPRKL